jgi:pimeloyl-ACP methyl ester carboxylesterase
MSAELLNYKRSGAGKALVFVHGYFGGSAQWENEIAFFQDRFDVIAVDLPGFGESSHLQPLHTVTGFAEAVIDLLNRLNIDEFYLLGHSMGGMIAQQIAFLLGDRVTKLTLYGTGPIGDIPNRFEPIETSRQRLKKDGHEATIRRISSKWFIDGYDSPMYSSCIETGFLACEEAGEAGLNAMETWDGQSQLSSLDQSTQIIWGEYDRSYRFSQIQLLWESIPNCSIAIIPRASHLAHQEQSQMFLHVLDDFLLA